MIFRKAWQMTAREPNWAHRLSKSSFIGPFVHTLSALTFLLQQRVEWLGRRSPACEAARIYHLALYGECAGP